MAVVVPTINHWLRHGRPVRFEDGQKHDISVARAEQLLLPGERRADPQVLIVAFPSLGPTAFLFFFAPRSPAATPRHAIYGHAIGLICGYGSLLIFGLQHAPSAMHDTVDIQRVLAAALSLSLTGAIMIVMNAVHPPAGATTLIVSLGIVTAVRHLLIIECAVALLTAQAILINRHAGIDYPLWS